MLVSLLSAPFVAVLIRLPIALIGTNVNGAIKLVILPEIVKMLGTLPLILLVVPPPPAPPRPPPSSPAHPAAADDGPSPSDPPAPSVPSGSGVEPDGPVPLMSVVIDPPSGGCDVLSDASEESPPGEPISSQLSLFSSSEEPIGEFSEEPSPTLSPSPSISSFTSPSGACSESILKDTTIVFNDPVVVEQILDSGYANNVDKDNVDGSSIDPKVVNNNSSDPKVVNNNSNDSKVVDNSSKCPKVADNNAKVSKNKGSKGANKSNVSSGIPAKTGPKVAVSSDNEPELKKPKIVPVSNRSRSRSPLVPSGVHPSLPAVADSRPSRPR